MRSALIIARVARVPLVASVAVIGGVYAALTATRIPREWIYQSAQSGAPVALICGVTSVMMAALMCVPRLEACEVTAARPLWAYRLGLVLTHFAMCLILAAASAIALNSTWHFVPLARSSLALAAATFAAAVVVPPRFVAAVGTAYLVLCFFVGRGGAWWDIMLAHPDVTSIAVTSAMALVFAGAFAAKGAISQPPEEEL